ncbi:MAG: hypothetical protein ACXVA9_09190, partial [Bdellovibrionales bacterium]
YFFFKEDLQRLGIELNLRVVPDTAAFIAELRKNTYDLVKSPLEIPREFDVVDVDILTQRLHSKYASSQFINNSANLKCPDVDRALDLLTSLEADSPQYPVAIDALLRVLSAKVPFIMIGERTTATVYADPKICLPPSTNAMMASASYCTGNNSLF